jgi:hypothetical protein
MKRIATAVALVFGLTLAAAPADAQLVNFPVMAVPTGAPSTFFGASFGRGLNEESGKQNAFGAFVGRSGLGQRVSVVAGVGMVNYEPDAKYTFGGDVAVAVLDADAETQVSVQGGIGYMSIATDVSTMNFPIGVAIRTTVASDSGNLGLWAMPRLNIARAKFGSLSDTSSDLGVSGGVSFTTSGGFGVNAALDVLAADASAMLAGVGVHYVVN